MDKLKRILLVDDSNATNFFNKTIISKTECAEEIIIALNGEEALESILVGKVPELIFLDINMPIMNGWEFLEAYQKLNNNYQKSIIVLMLGTPLLEEDKLLYADLPFVKEFSGKMLSKEVLHKIIKENIDTDIIFA